jgi:hypothetical protein
MMVAAVGWQLDAGMVAFADFSDTLLAYPTGATQTKGPREGSLEPL